MATTDFRIGALFNWSRSLIGRILNRNANTAPTPRTDSGTVRPYSGPGFDLVYFHYRPVSDKEKLPLYDMTPLAVMVSPPVKGVCQMLNIHWLPAPVLYTWFQYFKTGKDPSITPVRRQQLLQTMMKLVTNPKLPHRAVRSYRIANISNTYRLQPRDYAEIDQILRRFRSNIIPNTNEETQ